MKRIVEIASIAAIVVIFGCGGGGGTPGGVADGKPIISTLNPSSVAAGSGETKIAITGANYQHGVAITFNGESRPVKEFNIRQLEVTLTAADLATPGTFKVKALNPDGYISPAKDFVVNP